MADIQFGFNIEGTWNFLRLTTKTLWGMKTLDLRVGNFNLEKEHHITFPSSILSMSLRHWPFKWVWKKSFSANWKLAVSLSESQSWRGKSFSTFCQNWSKHDFFSSLESSSVFSLIISFLRMLSIRALTAALFLSGRYSPTSSAYSSRNLSVAWSLN